MVYRTAATRASSPPPRPLLLLPFPPLPTCCIGPSRFSSHRCLYLPSYRAHVRSVTVIHSTLISGASHGQTSGPRWFHPSSEENVVAATGLIDSGRTGACVQRNLRNTQCEQTRMQLDRSNQARRVPSILHQCWKVTPSERNGKHEAISAQVLFIDVSASSRQLFSKHMEMRFQ